MHGFDGEAVGVAAVGFEHADEVPSGSAMAGAEAFADWFVVGAVAEVVVAAGAGWFEHDLDLAGVARELEHRVAAGVERR